MQLNAHLLKLHLEDNTSNVSDADIDFLCKNCPCLSDLSFRDFKFFTSAALLSIARYLPMLEKLSVFEGVMVLAKGCVRLHSLHIYHCNNITDKSVQQVWLHCTQLEDLCLRGCSQITDAAFASCVHTKLRELNACETRVVGCFINRAPNLRTLHCDSSINSTFTQAIAAQPNTIQHLWIHKARLCAFFTSTSGGDRVPSRKQRYGGGCLQLCSQLPSVAVAGCEVQRCGENGRSERVVRALPDARIQNKRVIQIVRAYNCTNNFEF